MLKRCEFIQVRPCYILCKAVYLAFFAALACRYLLRCSLALSALNNLLRSLLIELSTILHILLSWLSFASCLFAFTSLLEEHLTDNLASWLFSPFEVFNIICELANFISCAICWTKDIPAKQAT